MLVNKLCRLQRLLRNEKCLLDHERSVCHGILSKIRENIDEIWSLTAYNRVMDDLLEQYEFGHVTLGQVVGQSNSKVRTVTQPTFEHYERVLSKLRNSPHVLVECLSDILRGNSSVVDEKREHIKAANVIYYTVFCSLYDSACESRFLQFVSLVMEKLFQFCGDTSNVLSHAFLKRLLNLYGRKVGHEYLCSTFENLFCDTIQRKDFNVSLQREQVKNLITKEDLNSCGAGLQDEEREEVVIQKIMQRNGANLYSICTRIISRMAETVTSVPYGLRYIAKVFQQLGSKYVGEDKTGTVESALRKLAFQNFISPAFVDPERYGICVRVPLCNGQREKLAIVTSVLTNTVLSTLFRHTNPFCSLNIFIRQNRDAVNNYFAEFVNVNLMNSPLDDNSETLDSCSKLCLLPPILVSSKEESRLLEILNSLSRSDHSSSYDNLGVVLEQLESSSQTNDSVLYRCSGLRLQYEDPCIELGDSSTPKAVVKRRLRQLLCSITNINSSGERELSELLSHLSLEERLRGRLSCAASLAEVGNDVMLLHSPSAFSDLLDEMCRDTIQREKLIVEKYNNDVTKLLRVSSYLGKKRCELEKLKEIDEKHVLLERFRPTLPRHEEEFFNFVRSIEWNEFLDEGGKKLSNVLRKSVSHIMKHLGSARGEPGPKKYAEELMKNLLFACVHDKFIKSPTPGESSRDSLMAVKLSALRPLSPKQLEIPEDLIMPKAWSVVIDEVSRLSQLRLPAAKLSSAIRICKTLYDLIALSGHLSPSADDFLPILVYVFIQANPEHLCSNLSFLMRYVHEQRKDAAHIYDEDVDHAAEYWLPHFHAAVLYLEDSNREELLVEAAEKETGRDVRAIRRRTRAYSQRIPEPISVMSNARHTDVGSDAEEWKTTVVREVSVKERSSETVFDDKIRSEIQLFLMRSRFAKVSFGDVKAAELSQLFEEYGELIKWANVVVESKEM